MNWIKTIFKTSVRNSLNTKKQKQFGYLVSFLLALYLSISIYKSGLIFNTKQSIVLIVLVIFIVLTLSFVKALYPLLFVWFLIGELLGKLSSFIILAIVYYIIFTPITTLLNSRDKTKRYSAKWIDRRDTINYEELS